MSFEFLANFPPALWLILGGFLIPFIKSGYRKYYVCLIPVLTLAHIWLLPEEINGSLIEIASFSLDLVHRHNYSLIFATVFALAALAGGIFALNDRFNKKEMVAASLYAGSAIGVTFAGDYISFFIYWELMAIGSTIIVWCGGSERAIKAGMRYAIMHLFGGVILMAGIISHLGMNGSAEIVAFSNDLNQFIHYDMLDRHSIALWLILIGVLVNAAAPPFSAWLPDAYPESSPAGGVFLSAFTTKTAVFTLITMFPGNQMLIYIGLFMVFYGIVMAILENDMRRILAYSIINQVGFMVTGIGIGTEMALSGAATHAFCHIIYKALLFMSAGSVLYMTGKSRCTDLGGLYKSMKLTMYCGIIGALAISAFPLTSGFVSKSMISSSAASEHMFIIWMLLAAASAGVFLHAGIKFPWFVFFHRDSGMRPDDPPIAMRIAMVFFAVLCIVPAIPGVAEHSLYKMLPKLPEYQAYTYSHVVAQLQLLLFAGLAFFVMLPMLKRTNTITLDFDWLYRKLCLYICVLFDKLIACFAVNFKKLLSIFSLKLIKPIMHHHSPEGILARNWPIGGTVLWVIALLGVYLIIYYMAVIKGPL